jgi:hypothetical protein
MDAVAVVNRIACGAAFKLPAHARIAVDVMYAGGSQPVTDSPQLALYFASATPATPVTTTTLRATADARTPARFGAESKQSMHARSSRCAPICPRGRDSLEIKLIRPDGSREVLLWVKDARQMWPTPYVFRKPVTMPAGSTVQAVAYGDAPITIALNHHATK